MPIRDRSFFAGWERRHDWPLGVEFFRLGAPETGVVRSWFPTGPTVPAARVVEAQLREMRVAAPAVAFEPGARGDTAQADHFVLFSLVDRGGATQLERRVGIVYTDRLMAIVDGLFKKTEAERFVPFVDELTRDFPMRDGGHVRFRRYRHHRPAGWATRTRDLTTYLIAPGAVALIEILPAQPLATDSIATRFLYEDVNLAVQPNLVERAHQTPGGLSGSVVFSDENQAAPAAMLVGGALLSDDAFHYILRYRAERSVYQRHRSEFLRVVDSVQPIARPSSATVLAASLTRYWID